jgi:hypothetical protein
MTKPKLTSDLLAGHSNGLASSSELDQRLGLYQVFLKLYEHHRSLLDEILQLEQSPSKQRGHSLWQYVQGVVQNNQVFLMTNLVCDEPQQIWQPQGIWVIGRDRKVAISVSDKRLSRRHAAIRFVPPQGFYLVDLNSTNGTVVNGEPVRQQVSLQNGDHIRLGSLSFTFFTNTSQRTASLVPAEVLQQIEASQRSSSLPISEAPTLNEPSCDANDTSWDTPASESTSLFLRPEVSVDKPSGAKPADLSASYKAAILDRFLDQQTRHRN